MAYADLLGQLVQRQQRRDPRDYFRGGAAPGGPAGRVGQGTLAGLASPRRKSSMMDNVGGFVEGYGKGIGISGGGGGGLMGGGGGSGMMGGMGGVIGGGGKGGVSKAQYDALAADAASPEPPPELPPMPTSADLSEGGPGAAVLPPESSGTDQAASLLRELLKDRRKSGQLGRNIGTVAGFVSGMG